VFATLLGALPRPPLGVDAAPEALLDSCLALQTDDGLEPLTDGGWPVDPADVVGAWRTTAARAGGLVKAVVVGPWTSGRPVADVRSDLVALADVGCRWIEVHEPAATALASDAAGGSDDRSRFADAHRELTHLLGSDVHLSLAVVGGNADTAGIETILGGTYASLALDLISGPDNWRVAVAAPSSVGIVCGALSTRAGSDDGPELLLWAADYAASSGGRGMDRVGLATAGSLAGLPWDVAATKVRRLGEAARLVTVAPQERRAAIDPRAIDIRSAALGQAAPLEPDGGAPSRRARPARRRS
jgi:hypothetical protein